MGRETKQYWAGGQSTPAVPSDCPHIPRLKDTAWQNPTGDRCVPPLSQQPIHTPIAAMGPTGRLGLCSWGTAVAASGRTQSRLNQAPSWQQSTRGIAGPPSPSRRAAPGPRHRPGKRGWQTIPLLTLSERERWQRGGSELAFASARQPTWGGSCQGSDIKLNIKKKKERKKKEAERRK